MPAFHHASRQSASVGLAAASQPRPRQGNNKDGYAAIDFGSTSTRAYLTTVNRTTKQISGYRVQKTGVDDDKKKRFLRGEWPSKGCPFDAPYPVGYAAAGREHADKRGRSLKSFVWFLAYDDDQHPYTRDLKNHHDSLTDFEQQREFRKRLMNMLVRHLTIVADQIVQEAVLRHTTIRRLVFCVPNAWDKPNFQVILRPIMDKVARGIETYCVFESEALSQFILHQHPYLLADQDFALVCDFGGHFMGGSLFQFCRESPDDDHPAFFSLPQGNFGARGGSQLWEDHIRPYIDAQLATLRLPVERESVLRAKFLDAFFISKNDVDAQFYVKNMPMRLVVSITDAFPDDTHLYPLYLKPAQILGAWELGFRTSIDLAIDKIRLLPVSSRSKTVVFLSGGSMQNYKARTEIQRKCKEYGIECQAVGFDVNVESSKWMVCEGAATAEACAMSAQDFFRRGAALAIQSFTREGLYKTNADVLFYGVHKGPGFSQGQLDMSRSEFNVGRQVEVEFSSHAHNRFRLVCDPLYLRNRHRYPPGCITILSDDATENNNCYDVWDVSRHAEATHANGTTFSIRLPHGKYAVEVEDMAYLPNSTDATLRLRLTRRLDPTPKPAVTTTTTTTMTTTTTTTTTMPKTGRYLRRRTVAPSAQGEAYTYDVPLSSCGPSNLVLLDLDLVKKRLWQPVPAARSPPPTQAATLDPTAAAAVDLALDVGAVDPQRETDEASRPRAAKRQRLARRAQTPEEEATYAAPGWAGAAPGDHAADKDGGRAPSESPVALVPKREVGAESPALTEFTTTGPAADADQEYTFELEDGSDSEDDGGGDDVVVDREALGHQIDYAAFAAFPISTRFEKHAAGQVALGLPGSGV